MFEIQQKFISQNRPHESLSPIGIVGHETDNEGSSALNHYNYYNSQYVGASAHAFVDWTQIIQTIPWNEVAWHAGYSANHRFIGIEWCHVPSGDFNKFNEVWKRGVWLYAYVFKNILGITVIDNSNFLSHKMASDTFKETNHQDPISYLKQYGKSWDDLKNAVQKCIDTNMIDELETKGSGVNMNPILQLQKDLNQLGHLGANGKALVEDGIYGANSKFAMQDFQSKNGLETSEELNDATRQLLDKIIRNIPLPTQPDTRDQQITDLKAQIATKDVRIQELTDMYYKLLSDVKSIGNKYA